VALRLVLLALALACAGSAAARQPRSLRILPPVWLPFLLWAGWAALAIIWSVEPGRSAKEFRNEIVYAGLAYFVCYIGAQAPRAARIFLPVAGAATTLLCAIAIYSFPQGNEHYQVGWHGGSGDLSSALLVLMPCVLVAGWHGTRAGYAKALHLSLALAGLILVAAYTTLNRTVWIGFAAEMVLLAGLLITREGAADRRRIRTAGVVLALAVIAGCALVSVRVQAQREAMDPAASLTSERRIKLWPEVLQQIEQRPLTGYGFGRGLLRGTFTEELNEPILWHAHNFFLDIALQTGLPGLALFLLLLGAIAREGWRALRSGDGMRMACGLALFGVLTGMVVRNMTDTLLVRQNALLFWALVGVLLAGARRPAT